MRFVLVTFAVSLHILVAVVSASSSASSATTATTTTTSSSTISTPPTWLTPRIAGNREKFAQYLELARQRHDKAVRQAQGSYFHGSAGDDARNYNESNDDSDKSLSLSFDKYTLNGNDVVLPDFNDELDPTLFVTSKSTPMFSKQECDELIQMVESHFEGKDWSRLPSGQYEVAGFWIRDLPAVHQWFNRMLQERLFPAMMAQFPDFCGVDGADMSDLCVDNAYLFKYTPETGRRTDTHTDSGCLSFTIALNPKEDYKGGGTWFEFLDGDNGIIEMDVGQVTLRPGGVRHCGHAVKRGTRYIIGGFCMNRKKVEHVRMLLQLAHEYSGENDLDKAQEALEAAILLNPRYDGPYSHLSDILTKKGDGDAAKRALTYCLESVNPRSQEVAFTLGSKLLEEGDWAGAKRCLQICLDVDPVDVEAMEAMAQVHAAMDDPSREFEMYQQIISIPDVKADILGRVYCNLGVLSQGKEEELAHFKKALEITPSSFPATYSLGCAHAAREQWDDGIKWFRRAVEIASDGSDDEMKALRTLYTTVAKKMQQENNQRASSPMPSREEMIRVFSEQMGPANFEKITKLGR